MYVSKMRRGFQRVSGAPTPCEGLPLGHLTKTSRALHTGRSHPAWPRRLPLTPLVRLGRVKLVERLGPKKRKRMTAPGFEPGSSGSQPLMLTTTPCHHVRVSGLAKNLWSRCFTGKKTKKELSVNAPACPPHPEGSNAHHWRGPATKGCVTGKILCLRPKNKKKQSPTPQDPRQFGYLNTGTFQGKKNCNRAKKIDVQQSKKRIKKASPRRDSNPQPPDPKSDTLSIAPRGPP